MAKPTAKDMMKTETRTAAIGIKTFPTLKALIDEAAVEDGRSTAQFIERLMILRLKELGKLTD